MILPQLKAIFKIDTNIWLKKSLHIDTQKFSL